MIKEREILDEDKSVHMFLKEFKNSLAILSQMMKDVAVVLLNYKYSKYGLVEVDFVT